LTPTNKGKLYGLIFGGLAVLILYFFTPLNETGNRIVFLTYGVTFVMILFSVILWIYHLKYSQAMFNPKMDNFIYTFTGVLFLFSIVATLTQGKLPIPSI